jgi:hypothetical protein
MAKIEMEVRIKEKDKKGKKQKIGMEETKLSLFIDDMIVHIDNLKESTSVYITR